MDSKIDEARERAAEGAMGFCLIMVIALVVAFVAGAIIGPHVVFVR